MSDQVGPGSLKFPASVNGYGLEAFWLEVTEKKG
jgi:hypothetical protein